jgi:hypothetical protein
VVDLLDDRYSDSGGDGHDGKVAEGIRFIFGGGVEQGIVEGPGFSAGRCIESAFDRRWAGTESAATQEVRMNATNLTPP